MSAETLFWMIACHFVGDYLIQTNKMATEKTQRWLPAIAHGLSYTLPFALLVTRSPVALLVIGGTHILIDHWRLAKYVVWFKNQFGAKREYVYRTPDDGEWGLANREWTRRYDATDRAMSRPIHEGMTVAPPWAKKIRVDSMAWPPTDTGYPAGTPVWLATWLMIIADNVIHVLINFGAVKWL